jgi:peptide/nickel transport system substrate-binding protein
MGFTQSWGGGARPIRTVGWLVMVALLLVGCAPTAPGTGRTEGSQSGGAPATTSGPKILRMAMQGSNEQDSPAMFGRSGSGSAAMEHFFMFHANLTALDAAGEPIARMAEKIPSINDGDWKVLPNGGMEVSWKLRPNIVWHDGTPLSAEDFEFGFKVATDTELPVEQLGDIPNMSSVKAVDPRTLVITWKTQSAFGNVNNFDGVPALPRHLLEAPYQTGDKVNFQNLPYWKEGWVGLGPYKLTRWVLGSHMEGEAFDQYFLGRPKIDRIVVRYLGDVNAIVANVLAGEVDVIPAGAQMDIGQMVVLKQQWEAAGSGSTLFNVKSIRTLYMQMRDPSAPWVNDRRVRQALLHTLNRDEMVETMLYGLTQRADYYVPPDSAVYQLAEQRGLPKYLFDPTRADRLLTEAGFTRGADRMYRNASGQNIHIDVTVDGQGDNLKEAETLAAHWSAGGMQSAVTPYPPGVSTADGRQIRHTIQGVMLWPWNFGVADPRLATTQEVGTERNRYVTGNYGGYSNPAYDGLWDQLANELDGSKRREIHFNMVKHLAEEVPVLPIFYRVTGTVVNKTLTGPGRTAPTQAASTWSIHEWAMK